MSVATFGAVVPPALLSPPLCAVLELARLGRWLQPPAELEGRSVALTLTDLGLRHGLCCRDGRFRPHGVADAELSLSASLADVLLLLAGQVRQVDVGRITPLGSTGPARHFLCWGGAGFDAQVNRNVEADPERKRRLGPMATFITSFLTLRDFAGTAASVP